MPDRIAVYTCVTGGFNVVGPHAICPDVDWIAFVDHDTTVAEGWEIRRINPRTLGSDHRRAAKVIKLRPDRWLPEYTRTIWIDGTVRAPWAVPDFPHEAMGYAERSGLALWAHPERQCLYDEAVASLRMPKYQVEPILEQVADYWRLGHPVNAGLWACGVLARVNTPFVRTLMSAWQQEIDRWSVQDQLSFAFVARRAGFVPGEFPGSLYLNPWVQITGHNPDR